MRVLVDENTAVKLMGPLRHLHPRHEIAHVSEIGWKGQGIGPEVRHRGMPAVMEELVQADGQRLVHIVSLDPGRRRFEIIDPSQHPPRYWPRRRVRHGCASTTELIPPA